MFAALGPRDYVAEQADETQPWAEAFAESPAPFGSSPAAAGITPVSSGSSTPSGLAHRYYAFDVHQNGGTLRVIVLDNSKGSLEESSGGQTKWLEEQLEAARAQGLPIVAVAALPLRGSDTSDGNNVASLLASNGVLAVFTTNDHQLDEHYLVPEGSAPGASQIPEYEGASLGYQRSENNGVKCYFVSVDTQAAAAQQAAAVHVAAIPVVSSLSLKPLNGLSVARSLTLQFEAVGRRPAGTLASTYEEDSPAPGMTTTSASPRNARTANLA
jgi:hypothetical protein